MNDAEREEAIRRSLYVGSSDVAGILGLSQWATPLDVWRAKVFPLEVQITEEKRRIFRRGHLMEPVIRTMAVEEYRLDLRDMNVRYHDPQYDWMRAEIDFETVEIRSAEESVGRLTPKVLLNNDAKSVHPFSAHKWGEEGTDEIPIEYHAQFQYGMMVTGRAVTHCYALFGTDNLVRYVIYRDNEAIAGIRQKVLEFWERVQSRRPPPPQTIEDVVYLTKRERARRVPATDELRDLLAQYRMAKDMQTSSEERAKALKVDIADAILEGLRCEKNELSDVGAVIVNDEDQVIGSFRCTMKDMIDTTKLREERPEIASQYARQSESWSLRTHNPKAPKKGKKS